MSAEKHATTPDKASTPRRDSVSGAQDMATGKEGISPDPAALLQRATSAPHTLTPKQVQTLQKTVGNRATTQMVQRATPPPTAAPVRQRQQEQREEEGEGTPPPVAAPARSSGGLPALLQAKMERAFGTDFSGVRVHSDSSKAVEARALAYTQGNDLHFAPGQFQPDSPKGQQLVGHELTHVMQQRAGRVHPTHTLGNGIAVNADPGLEREADTMGARAAQGIVMGSAHSGGDDEAAGAVLQGVFTYSATAILERGGAPTKTATDITIESINIPELKRPPTQFGKDQKAHAVSWTLVRKSYQAVGALSPALTVTQFIDTYLKPDWARLAKQEGKKNTPAQKRFNTYVGIYNDAYFNTLKTETHSLLEWHEKMQELVTDYLVALNLAPLSTHTGYLGETGKSSSGIKESTPSAHGERAANIYFADMEQSPPTMITEKLQEDVVVHAKYYWDTGTNMDNGIKTTDDLGLVWDEYETAFSRAYPTTWQKFKDDITAELKDKTIAKGSGTTGTPGTTDQEDVYDSNYNVRLKMGTAGQVAQTAAGFTVKELRLPDDRPPTKYGVVGQKSHTVSWTLVIKSLRNASRGKSLVEVLESLLLKWMSLKEQDWTSMQATDLIVIGDIKSKSDKTKKAAKANVKNQTRLQEAYDRISPNIDLLTRALQGASREDSEWVNLLQESVSEYVEVYQTSPLASYRRGAATNHGEQDSNSVLGDLSTDINHTLGGKWTDKLASLFDGSIWQGHDDSDRDRTVELINKTIDGIALTDGEMADLKSIVVKHLALNYLDARWDAVKKGGVVSLDSAPATLAQICFEWEETLKGAYPLVWNTYKAVFQAYSNNIALAPGLLTEQADALSKYEDDLDVDESNNSEWMKERRNKEAYRRGLVAIQRGVEADKTDELAAFNTAKADYKRGLAAIRADNEDLDDEEDAPGHDNAKNQYAEGLTNIRAGDDSRVGWLAFRRAKEDYNNGLLSIRGGNLDRVGHRGFGIAKQEYEEGIAAAQNGNPIGTGANAQGFTDYQNGVAAAQVDGLAGTGGQAQGHADYRAGIATARLGGVIGTGGHAQGFTDYQAGVTAAQLTQISPVGTGGHADGHRDYHAGVLAGQGAGTAQPGGHGIGFTDYRDGYLAGITNQTAATRPWAYQAGYDEGQRHAKSKRKGGDKENVTKKTRTMDKNNMDVEYS